MGYPAGKETQDVFVRSFHINVTSPNPCSDSCRPHLCGTNSAVPLVSTGADVLHCFCFFFSLKMKKKPTGHILGVVRLVIQFPFDEAQEVVQKGKANIRVPLILQKVKKHFPNLPFIVVHRCMHSFSFACFGGAQSDIFSQKYQQQSSCSSHCTF